MALTAPFAVARFPQSAAISAAPTTAAATSTPGPPGPRARKYHFSRSGIDYQNHPHVRTRSPRLDGVPLA